MRDHALGCGFDIERGGEQRARVVALGILEQVGGVAGLHDLAVPHHQQAARERGDAAQIVRDEKIGKVALPLQVAEQIDHLRLDQHVERACGLVEHDESRLEHDGARHRNALPLPAGEFMGKAEACFGIEPDFVQCVNDALVAFPFRHGRMVHLEAFLDDVGNRQSR